MDQSEISKIKSMLRTDLNDKQFAAMVVGYFSGLPEESLHTFTKDIYDSACTFLSSMVIRLKACDTKDELFPLFGKAFFELLHLQPDSEMFAKVSQILLSEGCVFFAAYGSKDPMEINPLFNKFLTELQLIQQVAKPDYDPDRVDLEEMKKYPDNIAELVN